MTRNRTLATLAAALVGVFAGATIGTATAAAPSGDYTQFSGKIYMSSTLNVDGTTTQAGAASFTGDVDIGDSATDTLTVTSVIDSNLVIDSATDHSIGIEASAAATAGKSLTIYAGDGTTTGDRNGGDATVRAGNAANSGVDGKLYLGNTNTSSVEVAASTIGTNVKGTLTCDENANLNGAITTVGNAATDTVVLTAVVNSSVTFDNGAARSIGIEAAAAATAGDNLTIYAGDGTTTGDRNGGNLVMRAGNAANSGTDGIVQLGVTNTSAITLGASGITTTSTGPVTVSEAMTCNGDTDIGNAATDTLTVTSVIDSSLTFDNGSARAISVEAAAAGANGDNLTLTAGAGTTTGDRTGGILAAAGGAGANNGAGGAVTLNGGAGPGSGAGGAVTLNGGTSSSGTAGAINLGVTTGSAVNISKSGVVTTVSGSFVCDEAANLNGAVTLGNAAGDDVTVTGSVASDLIFKQGAARAISVGSHASGAGNNLSVAAGAAFATSGLNGGNLIVRAGAKDDGGTDGVLTCGDANTSALNFGASTIMSTFLGTLNVDEAATFDGAVTLGNASTDDVTFTGSVAGNVSFKLGGAHTLNVAASAADAAGQNLSVAASAGGVSSAAAGGVGGTGTYGGGAGGAGGAAQLAGVGGPAYFAAGDAGADGGGGGANGGATYLRAGNASAAGTDGVLYCGDANTSAVEIATAGIATTVNGSFKVDEATTLDGAVTLGNAAGDAITVTGLVSGNVTFLGSAAHTLTVDTDDDGAGNNFSIAAGAAFGGAGGNGGDLALNAGAKDGGGTDGSIGLGSTTASGINIGNATSTTTITGTITTPASYPMLRKLTHRVQHSDLTDADGEEDEAIAGFPANSCPLYALVEVDTAFSGGSASAVTASVGDAGAATEVMAAITVFTGASGFTQGAAGANAGNCVFEASYSPIARFTCTTDTCLALTAGDAYIHLYYLTMAAVTP